MKTFALLLLVLTTSTLAQHSSSAQLEEMKKLDFLIGEWRGEGWAEFIPGQRRTSSITENVQPKLGGMVLLIEGLGKAKVAGKEEEVAVHHALGIVSYDATAKQYRLKSYLADGRSTEAEAEFVEEGFQWRFLTPQGVSIRYTVKLTEQGEWFEKGELSQDGKSWRQFHEMTLQKLK